MQMKKHVFLIGVLTAVLGAGLVFPAFSSGIWPFQHKAKKLYWFIPDGTRAEPDVFTVFRWAKEGKLPNIKKMIENGAYGYSIPDFPSHTPTNFASLLTGAHPNVHGIADGPMHVEGAPLSMPSASGFSSTAKKVPPVWKTLEDAGKKVALLSIPGSTPPELEKGITIRGRWGGWGADTPAVIYEPVDMLPKRKEAGKAFKLFFLGQRLTDFIDKKKASGWVGMPKSFSPALEAELKFYGQTLNAYIFDSSNDKRANYDSIAFSNDKKAAFLTLKQGVWSEWRPVELKWKDEKFPSNVRIKIIKLWDKTGNFRIRLFFNNINRLLAEPGEAAAELTGGAGPMVDFVDNWPAQLIYEEEDKDTFLEEAFDSLEWHKRAAGFVLKKYAPDVFIQDTYTPNQMLESRWWHRYIDKGHPDYNEDKAKDAWKDILKMYQGLDAILGSAMENADKDTLIVFSSDHGIQALYKQVHLNNLFAKKGWLKFRIDEKTGEPAIDWQKTKAVYLKMAYVYVNPNGLGGNWKRPNGPEYEKLRDEVIKAIREIRDEGERTPVVNAIKWEDAPKFYELPSDRIGDIVLEAAPGYQWWEEVTADKRLFSRPLNSGYKQSINPRTKSMWTPFVIMGPGVKKNFAIKEPISHVDQVPTFLKLLGVDIPGHVQGRVLEEILEK